MPDKIALITGTTGQDGAYLAELLLAKGYARAAGAEVVQVNQRGKGFVVRRMLSDVEADIYVLVDGDATYDASSARRMIGRLLEGRG
jgi:GDP-D-mannose dehydratase